MARALGAARAEAFVGRTPAASTSAVTCAARPRAFHGACRECALKRAIGDSAMNDGELERQGGPRIIGTAERDGAGVIAYDTFGDRQAGARAAGFGAYQRLEHIRQDVRLYRGPVVVHRAAPRAVNID